MNAILRQSFVSSMAARRLASRPIFISKLHTAQRSREAAATANVSGVDAYKYIPGGPVLPGTVNDATTFPPPNRTHGSHHWAFERLLSVALLPLTASTFALSSTAYPVLDGLLAISLVVHSHIGFDSMVVDYLHERKFPIIGKIAKWGLRTATVATLVGIYQFNTTDIGLTELIVRVWHALTPSRKRNVMTTENKMQYVRLGKSGLKVSKIILGTMSYGHKDWSPWVLEEEEGMEQIKAAYDLGINTFDTANVYSHGVSEIILGKAIKKYNLPRDEIVIMTKAFGTVGRTPKVLGRPPPSKTELEKLRYTNQQGLSRKHLFEAIKHSLERLQLDYVDVLQCHRFDPETPVEETMQALHDIVKAGYARYIGMSSCYAWQFYKMQSYARQHGLTEFISMQNLHNAVYREEEREMMPMLKDLGVGVIPWSPLAGGFLARPIDASKAKAGTTRGDNDTFMQSMVDVPFAAEVSKRIQEIAKKHNASIAQVALAWSFSKDFVSAPIIGTTSLEKLKDLVGSLDVRLTEEEIKAIDEPYQSRSIIGHS